MITAYLIQTEEKRCINRQIFSANHKPNFLCIKILKPTNDFS